MQNNPKAYLKQFIKKTGILGEGHFSEQYLNGISEITYSHDL